MVKFGRASHDVGGAEGPVAVTEEKATASPRMKTRSMSRAQALNPNTDCGFTANLFTCFPFIFFGLPILF
jgi:hypothetical protein